MKPLKPWQITTAGCSPGSSGRSARPWRREPGALPGVLPEIFRVKGTVSLMARDCRLGSMTTTPDITGEYRALREGCGLARPEMGRLEILGADRHRFLNAYVTCDVQALQPGEGAYGFLTNPQGRILSDLVATAHEDRLWLRLPPGQEEAVAKHLGKYILADRVEIRPLEDMLPITLIGPGATAALGGAELPPEGTGGTSAPGSTAPRWPSSAPGRIGRRGLHPLGLGLDRRPAGRAAAGGTRGEAGRLRGPGGPAGRGGHPPLRAGLRAGELPAGDRGRGGR